MKNLLGPRGPAGPMRRRLLPRGRATSSQQDPEPMGRLQIQGVLEELGAGYARLNPVAFTVILRLRGDRQSLLAALACHWVDQQLGIPAREDTTPAPASPNRSTADGGTAPRG